MATIQGKFLPHSNLFTFVFVLILTKKKKFPPSAKNTSNLSRNNNHNMLRFFF